MYVGVLVCFTTVVTYSKYISKMVNTDSARVAKFDVTINPLNCNPTLNDETKKCNIGINRPTRIDYAFSVDTTNIEVQTQLYIYFYINKSFILNPSLSSDAIKNATDVGLRRINNVDYEVYKFTDNIDIADVNRKLKKEYIISVKYNSLSKLYDEVIDDASLNDIVRVGYSAMQIKM